MTSQHYDTCSCTGCGYRRALERSRETIAKVQAERDEAQARLVGANVAADEMRGVIHELAVLVECATVGMSGPVLEHAMDLIERARRYKP